jgi:hypothetical protein
VQFCIFSLAVFEKSPAIQGCRLDKMGVRSTLSLDSVSPWARVFHNVQWKVGLTVEGVLRLILNWSANYVFTNVRNGIAVKRNCVFMSEYNEIVA